MRNRVCQYCAKSFARPTTLKIHIDGYCKEKGKAEERQNAVQMMLLRTFNHYQEEWNSIVYDTERDYFVKRKIGYGIDLVVVIGLKGATAGFSLGRLGEKQLEEGVVDNDLSKHFKGDK